MENLKTNSVNKQQIKHNVGLITSAFFLIYISIATVFGQPARIGTVTLTPSLQTTCIPSSGNTTVSYTIKSTRLNNGIVNGVFTISGVPSGVTASTLAGFTSTGSNTFPDRILTLTIASSASAGSYVISIKLANGISDYAIGTGTLVLNIAPTITCPANISVNNDSGTCGAVVNYTNPAIATGSPIPTISYSPSSGTVFPKGITTVTAIADNICGTATCSFTVTVLDNEPPIINDIGASSTINCPLTPLFSNPTVTDNCPGTTLSFADVTTAGSCNGNYSVTRTWTAKDASNNTSTASQIIDVQDITAPDIVELPAVSTISCPYIPAFTQAVASDLCDTSVLLSFSDVTTSGTCPGNYSVTRTWTATDACNNSSTTSQIINVQDIIPPTITCSSNKVVNANNDSSSYINVGTEWDLTANDDCSNTTIKYLLNGATLSTEDLFSLNNVVFNLGLTTVTVTAYDQCNNTSTSCVFTVFVSSSLSLTVTNSNPQLFYGYSADQSTILTGCPSGGVPPYKVVITQNRALIFNNINSSGDEIWTACEGGSSIGCSCSPDGVGSIPVSTNLNVESGGCYYVTATLLENAIITFCVTDAVGSTITQTTNVYCEDTRCFAGNSEISKVKICHKTGNSEDPCHELCVDDSAVPAHLAHGDYIGSCLVNCTTPSNNEKIGTWVKEDNLEIDSNSFFFDVKIYPNPTNNEFLLNIDGGNGDQIEVIVCDLSGRKIEEYHYNDTYSMNFGKELPIGVYFAIIRQSSNEKILKLIKQ